MSRRSLLRGLIALLCCLPGCAGTSPVTGTRPPPAATPIVAIPDGCAPLVEYQSIDFRGASCVAVFCEDGTLVRTGTCAATSDTLKRLTEQEMAGLRNQVDESQFFALESYYPASTDC